MRRTQAAARHHASRPVVSLHSDPARGTSAADHRSPGGYHPFTIRLPTPTAGEARLPPMTARILIIEDDDVIAPGMARHLQAAGFETLGVANGETGLARLRFERPDVCVLDLML